MEIPGIIPAHTLAAYGCSTSTTELTKGDNRIIRSENFSWDNYIIPDLTILALKVIAENWTTNPVLDSLPTQTARNMLIEMLPTTLPFELVIKHISDEFFWKRASQRRWKYNNLTEHGDSWRRLYCERHFSQYLEQLDPKTCETELSDCIQLAEYLKEYVFRIKIRSLIPNKVEIVKEDVTEYQTQFNLDQYIPLNIILPLLSNLQELYINIGVMYKGNVSQRTDFEFSITDCKNLGTGIRACENLKKLNISHCKFRSNNLDIFLQQIVAHNVIQEMDLSHCTLGNSGAFVISKFLIKHSGLQILNLMNNNIAPEGLQKIVNAITTNKSLTLKTLNFRLNPLGHQSASLICSVLQNCDSLKFLNLSGCNLESTSGKSIAKTVTITSIKLNELDLSNNNFDIEARKAFELQTKSGKIKICRI